MRRHSVRKPTHNRKKIYIYLYISKTIVCSVSCHQSTFQQQHILISMHTYLFSFLKVGIGYLLSLVLPRDYNRFIDRDPKVNFQLIAGQAQMEVFGSQRWPIPLVQYATQSTSFIYLQFMEVWISKVVATVIPVCHLVHTPHSIAFVQILRLKANYLSY